MLRKTVTKYFIVTIYCERWERLKTCLYLKKNYALSIFLGFIIVFSTLQDLESTEAPEKYAFFDLIVPMALKIFSSNLKILTRLLHTLGAIFNNIFFS